jgi:hypothetical protein
MNRLTKQLWFLVAFWGTIGVGMAFSLLGPSNPQGNAAKGWQVQRIGYNLPGDIGGPMHLIEGYRWTIPTITYAFDQSFINYFGTNGMNAIDRAMEIFNGVTSNGVNRITDDGTQLIVDGRRVPFDTRFRNFELQTLGLQDLKSHAMTLLIEELGLAESERWIWALAGRSTFGNPPITNYIVTKLNFDPITRQPSSLVNGVLYTYQIFEFQNPDVADAIEFSLDPLAFSFTSVAGRSLFSGEFYAGLTHDDVGGLKWLYGTNNLAVESLLPTVTGGRPVSGGSSPWAPFLGTTNVFFIGTNFFFSTNIFGTNNLRITELRPGVNTLRFQKVSFDSLVGQTFIPVTNRYTDTSISNALPVIQPVERRVATPDIVFVVEDLGLGPGGGPFFSARTGTTGWINNDLLNGSSNLGGPGVIPPPIQITFTSLFPVFLNQNPGFADEFSASPIGIWATFDETVDEPIIYPVRDDLTLDDLRDFVLGRRSP